VDELTRAYELDGAEIRAQGSGSRQRFHFTGYAAPFGKLSRELQSARGKFRERIEPKAFDAVLASGEDVRFLLNHEPRLLLGRTQSGTLELAAETRGLHVASTLPNTSYARDYAELVERGDASEMSFRFRPGRESWLQEGGERVRSIASVAFLREVSALTEPAAYADTEAAIELRHARTIAEAEEELRAGRTLSAENLAALKEAHAYIAGILERAGAASEEGDEGEVDERAHKLKLDVPA